MKTKVKNWAKRIGHDKAIGILQAEGLSYSMAYKLVLGRYKHNPKHNRLFAIQRSLRRNK